MPCIDEEDDEARLRPTDMAQIGAVLRHMAIKSMPCKGGETKRGFVLQLAVEGVVEERAAELVERGELALVERFEAAGLAI